MLEIILALVQLALVGAALWYTIETRKLRVLSEPQMEMLRRQGRLSVAPLLMLGLVFCVSASFTTPENTYGGWFIKDSDVHKARV